MKRPSEAGDCDEFDTGNRKHRGIVDCGCNSGAGAGDCARADTEAEDSCCNQARCSADETHATAPETRAETVGGREDHDRNKFRDFLDGYSRLEVGVSQASAFVETCSCAQTGFQIEAGGDVEACCGIENHFCIEDLGWSENCLDVETGPDFETGDGHKNGFDCESWRDHATGNRGARRDTKPRDREQRYGQRGPDEHEQRARGRLVRAVGRKQQQTGVGKSRRGRGGGRKKNAGENCARSERA